MGGSGGWKWLAQCEGSVWRPQRKPGRVLASDDVDAVVHWQVLQCVLRIWLRFASLCSRLVHATTSLAFAKYQHDLNSLRSCGCRGPLASVSICPLFPPVPCWPLPSSHPRTPFRPHLQIINMISKSLDHVYAVVHWQVLQSTPSPPPLASPAFALAPPTPAI